MADRTAASLFCEIFELIAEHVPAGKRRKVALHYWSLSRSYDFSPCQMGADEALLKLGLARMGVNPDYPEDGEVMLYGPED